MAEAKEAGNIASVSTTTTDLLVIGASEGAGLVLVGLANRAGLKVFGMNEKGTEGAMRIRAMGGIPISGDITREGEIRSALSLSKAQAVVNFAAQAVLGIPQANVDYETLGQKVEAVTEAVVSAAGKMGVKRIIQLSAAYLYGETHEAVDESAKVKRNNPLFKALNNAERAVFDGGIAGYVLRAGYVYGGWDDSAITLAETLRKGTGIVIGSGAGAFLHEDDLASVALKIVQLETTTEASANVFNVANDTTLSHKTFLDKFGVACGMGEPNSMMGFLVDFRTSPIQRELLGQHFSINTAHIKNTLGWKPQYATPEAGLDKMTMIWRAQSTPATASEKATTGKELATR